jgi:hypothetical protein
MCFALTLFVVPSTFGAAAAEVLRGVLRAADACAGPAKELSGFIRMLSSLLLH